MKRNIITLLIICFISVSVNAQEETKEKKEKKDRPVAEAFFCGYLIDAQTTVIQEPKTLEFAIQHKFGTFENGAKDIWGIYNSANVRLGLDYVVYKNVQVGWGLTRTDMTHDFNIKYTILEQTRKNTIPVAVALYANMGLSQRSKEAFGTEYEFTDRMSYFTQLIVGRKFGDRIALQLGVSYSHFNQAKRATQDFSRIGLHANGRVKLTGTGSFIFNYDHPLTALQLTRDEQIDLRPNISFGWEIATITHAFQIYMGYSNEILPQYYMARETKEFDFEQFNIGFTITRMWN